MLTFVKLSIEINVANSTKKTSFLYMLEEGVFLCTYL